jgi:hypothetical protein
MSGIFQLQQTTRSVCFTSFVTISLDVDPVIGGNLYESRKSGGQETVKYFKTPKQAEEMKLPTRCG